MKATILVVDDEEITRKTLAEILRLEDYQVDVEPDGESAIQHAKQKFYRVILLDVRLPGITGIEALKILSEISPDSHVILMTGYGSFDSAIEAVKYHAYDYLLKPVSSEEILSAVHRALVSGRRTEPMSVNDSSTIYGEARVGGVRGSSNLILLGYGAALDRSRRWIVSRAVRVELTRAEARLLEVMVENRGKVVRQSDLVLGVQGYEVTDAEATNILRPLVSRLRSKLKQVPGLTNSLKNVRGSGYVLEMPEDIPPTVNYDQIDN